MSVARFIASLQFDAGLSQNKRMLPFGKIISSVKPGRRHVLNQWMQSFEQAGCIVEKEQKNGQDALWVSLPSLDSELLPLLGVVLPGASRIQSLGSDRMQVWLDAKGNMRYRLDYWGSSQIALHLLIATAFALEAWFQLPSAGRFLSSWMVAHAVCAAIFLASFELSRRLVLKRALATN